jgi:hypothetical protein
MMITMAAAIAVFATGCASKPAPAPTYAQNEPLSQTAIASEEAKQTADPARVLDWANRGLGKDASPAWLLPALNAAMTIADVQYAAWLTDFWQLTETVDRNGRIVTAYNYYVVCACDPDVWSKLVAKYLLDVTGNVQDQRAKQTIAAMFNEIDAETRYEREKSELDFAAEIRARQAALQFPVPPADQRAAYRSGDAARIAAASATAADADYIAALAALAGIE